MNQPHHSSLLNNVDSQQGFTEAGRQREKRKLKANDENLTEMQVGTPGTSAVGDGLKRACYRDVARDGGFGRPDASGLPVQSRRKNPQEARPANTPNRSDNAMQVKVSTSSGTKGNLGRKERTFNPRNAVVGSCSSTTLKSAPKPRTFYAGFWERGTTSEQVLAHLRSLNVSLDICEQLKTRHPSYCSFKFECDIRFKDILMNSNNWPEGIVVKRFYENRPKTNVPENAQASGTSVVNQSKVNLMTNILNFGDSTGSNSNSETMIV